MQWAYLSTYPYKAPSDSLRVEFRRMIAASIRDLRKFSFYSRWWSHAQQRTGA